MQEKTPGETCSDYKVTWNYRQNKDKMMQNDHKTTRLQEYVMSKKKRKMTTNERQTKRWEKRCKDGSKETKRQNTKPSQRAAKRQQKDAKRTQINTKQLQRDTKRPVRDTKSLQSNPPKLRPFHVWPCCLIDRGGTILKRFSSSKSTVTLIQFESSQIQF